MESGLTEDVWWLRLCEPAVGRAVHRFYALEYGGAADIFKDCPLFVHGTDVFPRPVCINFLGRQRKRIRLQVFRLQRAAPLPQQESAERTGSRTDQERIPPHSRIVTDAQQII